jgi:hypothetical protein
MEGTIVRMWCGAVIATLPILLCCLRHRHRILIYLSAANSESGVQPRLLRAEASQRSSVYNKVLAGYEC